MYYLEAEASMDAAHFLAGYQGKCGNIHGHRWRILAKVCGDILKEDEQSRGMLVDFGQLKDDLKEEVDYFDHSFIIEKDTLKEETMKALMGENFLLREVDFRPTAENFATYFYGQMKKRGYQVHEITVYETPNNCACYSEV
ncbi:MAG: 6-carboxytetrahydropterin synthase [Lachnospiraceae bacterium]|nr:6-carboxytetrahydropterin synthase [Lachnospiraceae bacterium]